MGTDLTFFTSPRLKTYISDLVIREATTISSKSSCSCSEKIFTKVTSSLDYYLIPEIKISPLIRDPMPLAVVIDLSYTMLIDFSGLYALREICDEARVKNIKVVIINEQSHLIEPLKKFGIENDDSNIYVDLNKYLMKSSLPKRPIDDLLPDNPYTCSGDIDNLMPTNTDSRDSPGILVDSSFISAGEFNLKGI